LPGVDRDDHEQANNHGQDNDWKKNGPHGSNALTDFGFQNPRSGWEHKAWGGAKRNPRLTTGEQAERAKRAIAQTLQFTQDEWLSPASRALSSRYNDRPPIQNSCDEP
jgi:hypothetical protein